MRTDADAAGARNAADNRSCNDQGNDTRGVGTPQRPRIPHIGDPVPLFTRPDLTGQPLGLADFQGSLTLVLFWNPRCGYCHRMLGDLRMLETTLQQTQAKLVLISSGSVEENQRMELHSPILIDNDFALGSAFGAGGTPSAVLMDAQGRIASELAVGATAVLELGERLTTLPQSKEEELQTALVR